MQSRFESNLFWYATCGKAILVLAINETYTYTNMFGTEEGSIQRKQWKHVKREDSLVLYGFECYSMILLHSLAQCACCTLGSRNLWFKILVEKSILVFAIHDKYI